MATITISLSGSAVINGTKSYTVNDADLQLLLNWAKATLFPPDATPTNQQILLAWVQNFISTTVNSVQVYGTRAPLPPPISIA